MLCPLTPIFIYVTLVFKWPPVPILIYVFLVSIWPPVPIFIYIILVLIWPPISILIYVIFVFIWPPVPIFIYVILELIYVFTNPFVSAGYNQGQFYSLSNRFEFIFFFFCFIWQGTIPNLNRLVCQTICPELEEKQFSKYLIWEY